MVILEVLLEGGGVEIQIIIRLREQVGREGDNLHWVNQGVSQDLYQRHIQNWTSPHAC